VLVKFLSFASVGCLGTLAHYAWLYALVEWRDFGPVAASACGAVAGLLVNYVLNFKLTFKSRQPHNRTFPKFALIACCGMGFNAGFMEIFTAHFYYLYAQVMTTLLVLMWNFFANLAWTFNMDHTRDAASMPALTVLRKKPGLLTSLLLTALLIRLATLGLYPLYDPSESRYAEMARKMVETDNWVTPMIDYGVPFWGKPPLTIWLTAFSMSLGGVNEWAARLPSLLLNCGAALIVYYLLNVQRTREQSLNAVFILASCVLFFVMSGTVAMDLAMNLGITLALTGFWLAVRHEKPVWGLAFFIGLSIGMLAKGPITLVLTGAVVGPWTLFTGRWLDLWRRIHWIKGMALMLLICAPWYWLAEQRTPGFLEYFFIGEHWQRFTESNWKGDLYGSGRGHSHGMIWLYWLAGGFPWTLILLFKLGLDLIQKRAGPLFRSDDGWRLYCWLWALTPVLFFSFSANVIWTYVLPGLPGLALLLCDSLPAAKFQRIVLGLTVPLAFLGLVVYYQFPESDFYTSQKRIVETYTGLAAPGEQLVYLNEKIDYSAHFYLRGKVMEMADLASLQARINQAGHDFYVLRQPIVDELPETVKQHLQLVKSYGRYRLFHAISG
jgi:putative flippase GtrA